MTNDIKIVRFFTMAQAGNATKIKVIERNDGNVSLVFLTDREGLEPSHVTAVTITPQTLNLLSEVIFIAAHGSPEWITVPTL